MMYNMIKYDKIDCEEFVEMPMHTVFIFLSLSIIHMNTFIHVHLDTSMGFYDNFRTCLKNVLHGTKNQFLSLMID